MSSTNQTIIKVEGMSCSGCANTVEESISQLEGVRDVAANFKDGTVSVKYESNDLTSVDFQKAVEDSGYDFAGIK